MALQQLGDVGLQGDEVGRILGVAADRDRARHMTMNQPEGTTKEVDPRGNHRRPDPVVVDHQRLDQVVEMALVIGDVDDPAPARGVLGDAHVLVDALDLAQNRVEGMFEGAVDRVTLGGPQLVEVGVDPLPGFQLRLPVPSPQVAPYVFPRQHRLGDVVEHAGRDYIKEVALYTDILDPSVPRDRRRRRFGYTPIRPLGPSGGGRSRRVLDRGGHRRWRRSHSASPSAPTTG